MGLAYLAAAAAIIGMGTVAILPRPSEQLPAQAVADLGRAQQIAVPSDPARPLGTAQIRDAARFGGWSAPLDANEEAAHGKDVTRAPQMTPEPESPPPNQIYSFTPPFEIIDARTFASGRWAVVLDGVTGPERDAVCINSDGLMFGCGLQARAALNNVLRRRPVQCKPRAYLNSERMLADCTVGGDDVGSILISRGWLRPNGTPSPTREAALRAAEAAANGMWNGGWRVR